MAWENIEDRLKTPFTVKVSLPGGVIWLPDRRISIDQWLLSIAQSDEELRELNIRRIRFLQNRWPLDKLVSFRSSSMQCSFWAMSAGGRAYILLFVGFQYQLIAAIEPPREAGLFREVIARVLDNSALGGAAPADVTIFRPDLVGDLPVRRSALTPVEAGDAPHARHDYLSELLVGWVGKWVTLPVIGYWHEDSAEPFTTEKEVVMKFKPTYADKQREKQKREKEEAELKRKTGQENAPQPEESDGEKTAEDENRKRTGSQVA
jgi:hypothetical protein